MRATTIKDFPISRLSYAKEALQRAYSRLARAAKRAGAPVPPAPELAVGSVRVRSTCKACRRQAEDMPSLDASACPSLTAGHAWRAVEIADLELRSPSLRLAGWEFLAVVEPLSGGNLIRSTGMVALAEGELDQWRTGAIRCDHCRSVRKRTETFIVRSVDAEGVPSGTIRQVGRNCLESFLGGASPAAIIAQIGWPDIVRAAAGDSDGEGGWSGVPTVYDPLTYLGWVVGVIREYGWLSRGAARQGDGPPATANVALYLVADPPLNERGRWASEREKCAPSEADLARAAAALEWARQMAPSSDYERSLSLVARQPALRPDHAGILASVVTAHMRFLGASVRRADLPPSRHIGAVGEAVELTVVVERVRELPTQWGAMNIIVMRAEDGAVVVWRTGSRSAAPGARFRLSGKVKAHSEFGGEAQTEVARCRLETI